MKKFIALTLTILSMTATQSGAQPVFATVDSVDINNINAAVMVHGDMWYDPATETPRCSFPNGSGKNIGFAAALWMSGFDGGNNLHVAAQTYRQNGSDYWPGPLDGADTLTYATSHDWAKIWKVTRKEIQVFQLLSAMGTANPTNTAAVIWEWPGKGSTSAKGNGGVPLTVVQDMAPFIDINGNGIYEPTLGDYPDVKGDQALWWVYSDNGPTHTETNGKPLGIEVHAMAYAYKRWTPIDNVIYYQYNIKNKSANTYHSFRTGQWADVDLGYYLDDFIGCDTVREMGIIYNGNATDAIYGTNMPIAGVIMRPMSGVTGGGSFMYYNNDTSILGNPTSPVQYDNYLRSEFRDGSHATYDFTGAGIPTNGHGAGPATDYVFSGDPGISSQWSECSSGNTPGDRRFILTTGDMSLDAGASVEVVSIQVSSNLAPNNACGSGVSFTHIQGVADTAIAVLYGGGLTPIPLGVATIPAKQLANIFPNPANDRLFIENTAINSGEESITVYNMTGQQVVVAMSKKGATTELDISKLPNGLYNVVYISGGTQTTARFMKE
jgi:type IX secretion system substrate protein